MSKVFVLDTNVLIHNPRALETFEEHDVALPLEVISELDGLKSRPGETGMHARHAIRELSKYLGNSSSGSLGEGKGDIRVLSEDNNLENGSEQELAEIVDGALSRLALGQGWPSAVDNKIIDRALYLASNSSQEVVLVSNDGAVRIKGAARGESLNHFSVESYKHDSARFDLHDFFRQGDPEIPVNTKLVNRLYQGKVPLRDFEGALDSLRHNQYVTLLSHTGKSRVLAKLRGDEVSAIDKFKSGVWKVNPRNREQSYAFDALMDPRMNAVALLGKAGTGKTFLALAAGLHQTDIGLGDERRYSKVIVVRPTHEVGKELGFLPGDLNDKISVHYAAIDGAMAKLVKDPFDKDGSKEYSLSHVKMLRDNGLLNYMPINYMRGQTFDDAFVIVDEPQNFTPHEIKTIGTRMGENSKIVLVGDPFQVDSKYLNEKTNGLAYATDRFIRAERDSFAYVILTQGERSPLSEMFADEM